MRAKIVGLVVAMSAEAKALTGCAQPMESVVRVTDRALLRVGGMGGAAAEASCAELVSAGATALVSVGCAAGLARRCRAGDLVVPEQVQSQQGEVLAVDPAWRAALIAGLGVQLGAVPGNIAGVDEVIGPEEKRGLHARTGAVAADMESVSVARFCRRSGFPMIALRVISDGPEDQVPASVLPAVDAFGRVRYGPLFAALVRRPGDIVALARLRAGLNTACHTLSLVAGKAGPELCCR